MFTISRENISLWWQNDPYNHFSLKKSTGLRPQIYLTDNGQIDGMCRSATMPQSTNILQKLACHGQWKKSVHLSSTKWVLGAWRYSNTDSQKQLNGRGHAEVQESLAELSPILPWIKEKDRSRAINIELISSCQLYESPQMTLKLVALTTHKAESSTGKYVVFLPMFFPQWWTLIFIERIPVYAGE